MSTPKIKSWFWPLQITVWCIVGFLNLLLQHFNTSLPSDVRWVNFIGVCGGGFLITSLYRYYIHLRRYNFNMNTGRAVLLLFTSSIIQSLCWLGLVLILSIPITQKYHISVLKMSGNLIPFLAMTLIWDLAYLGYKLTRQYHHTEVEKWKLEAEVQKAQLGALKSQINPHFMFNALNNIRSLILEDPALARNMLTRFSEIFRYALQHSEEKEIVLAEEIDILQQYFELLKIQYEDKLQYQINADQAVLQEKIPPMILQLLVENAVKHGIGLSPGGGEIHIDITHLDGYLVMSVKNTGTLSSKNKLENSLGIGLKNITQRLQLLYKGQARLEMTEQAPYVIVTISIKKS